MGKRPSRPISRIVQEGESDARVTGKIEFLIGEFSGTDQAVAMGHMLLISLGRQVATEIKGLSLFKARLREAWILRSYSNWTGKAWGGGRCSGSCEVFSEEVTE
jgi:hypothetical protein